MRFKILLLLLFLFVSFWVFIKPSLVTSYCEKQKENLMKTLNDEAVNRSVLEYNSIYSKFGFPTDGLPYEGQKEIDRTIKEHDKEYSQNVDFTEHSYHNCLHSFGQ